MTQQTSGTPDLKYSEETFRDLYEACVSFVAIMKTDHTYKSFEEVMMPVVTQIQQALAKAEVK